MAANSVDTQNGQYRAKQAEMPSVCNEQVLPPKGKICSELHGNMQRLAEMTSPAVRQVTECNTKYIYWRPHARRNMVHMEPRAEVTLH